MSDQIKIALPKLGESIVSATVLQWFKKEGDMVSLDEPLLEVSTDKINSEIPSPAAGRLSEILVKEGQEVQVGETLAILSTQKTAMEEKQQEELSPAVLRLLQEKGIALEDIARIPRSGAGGRLTKKDVESFAVKKPSEKTSSVQTRKHSEAQERVPMTPLRKAIADNMVRSFYEAPHASLVIEVDVTDLMRRIEEEKKVFLEKTGAKLTITSFAARALVHALESFPLLNASLEDDTIVMKRFVHLGIAVSVEHGVMVPVVRHAEKLFVEGLSKVIARLAQKARSQSLEPDEVQEGSITLTNFGMTGTLIGIPIIRHPEVAIVGLGAISKEVKPMADQSIAIRSVMKISLTFDHRVLDGLYGCGFLAEMKKQLEEILPREPLYK